MIDRNSGLAVEASRLCNAEQRTRSGFRDAPEKQSESSLVVVSRFPSFMESKAIKKVWPGLPQPSTAV